MCNACFEIVGVVVCMVCVSCDGCEHECIIICNVCLGNYDIYVCVYSHICMYVGYPCVYAHVACVYGY